MDNVIVIVAAGKPGFYGWNWEPLTWMACFNQKQKKKKEEKKMEKGKKRRKENQKKLNWKWN